MKIIHQYQDEFVLTGMTVREDHGMKAGILFEDPATDQDKTMDNSLWQVSYALSTTFLRGRDCEPMTGDACNPDGVRDVRFDNMDTTVTAIQRSTEPVTIKKFNYDHAAYISHIAMTETKKILTTHFDSVKTQIDPTLLFVQEEDFRQVNLDSLTVSGAQISADMSTTNAPRQIIASMKWAPLPVAIVEQFNPTPEQFTIIEHLMDAGDLEGVQ